MVGDGAGVGMMKVRRKSDGYVYGGWAAEYAGHADGDKAKDVLYHDLEVPSCSPCIYQLWQEETLTWVNVSCMHCS